MLMASQMGPSIRRRKEPEMLADFEYKFNQHDETIRRAETRARQMAALTPAPSGRDVDRPTGRFVTLLRRLAGTAATA